MPAPPGDFETRFKPFKSKMISAGIHPLVIESFRRHVALLFSGATGVMSRTELAELADVPDSEALSGFALAGAEALKRTVMIKLNGGLGTSMGLDTAKSLIPVRDGLRFIDIIARQVLRLREVSGSCVPLLLLNSSTTQDDCLNALHQWPGIESDLPEDLLQHRVPKIIVDTFAPAEWPMNPGLEWCPPGHGDLYLALETTGLLDTMLARGYRYAFVSNADNLGATVDAEILGYFASRQYDFMMEVADRTPADRKGGHLARLVDGRLALRERAQCPEEELDEFQDIALYRYFNTNSLWVHLPALRELLDRHEGLLPLPLIRNAKTVDSRDPASPKVYQLETAMGAAISLFDRGAALRVPRSRFAPVKTTDDLLAVRSDAMTLDSDFRIVPNPLRTLPAIDIVLDPQHYRFVQQLDERTAHGAPSLLHCASLHVRGDVYFGKNIELRGSVRLEAAEGETLRIPDNTILEGA